MRNNTEERFTWGSGSGSVVQGLGQLNPAHLEALVHQREQPPSMAFDRSQLVNDAQHLDIVASHVEIEHTMEAERCWAHSALFEAEAISNPLGSEADSELPLQHRPKDLADNAVLVLPDHDRERPLRIE